MSTNEFIQAVRNKKLVPARYVGRRYEACGPARRFCDRVTFFYDGRIRFERYCYGEAAGLVAGVWASGITEEGILQWEFEGTSTLGKEIVPLRLTKAEPDNLLFFDEKAEPWKEEDLLEKDLKNGYRKPFLGGIFSKR